MSDIKYRDVDLKKIRYIKLLFVDTTGNSQEIRTEPTFLKNGIISLRYNSSKSIELECPQDVKLKFIFNDGAYMAQTSLLKIKKVESGTYMAVLPPVDLTQLQNRKHYRIKVGNACRLIATDFNGHTKTFDSRLVDVSAGGVLMYDLHSDSKSNSDTVLNPKEYDFYNILLKLAPDIDLNMKARFVRENKTEHSHSYAFEFIDTLERDVDKISKFVMQEQMKQLRNKDY